MTYIRVRAAAEEVAKRGTITPHQAAALGRLDELIVQRLTAAERQEVTDLWRAQGSPADPAPQPTSPTLMATRPLLDLIAVGEGDYNSVNRGRAGDTPGGWPGLERLTIGEVQSLQAIGTLFAVGRYQFIPETLKIAVAVAELKTSDLFSPTNQDRLGLALLIGGKRPDLRDYLQGKNVSIEAAQLDLAKEWASIPMANGQGFYDGDSAGNRATAKVVTVQAALQAARKALSGTAPPPAKPPTTPPTTTQLRLTQAGSRDGRGLEILRLDLVENGKRTGRLLVVSGAPGAQRFRLGRDSRAGSLEPLPQGRWQIEDIAWAAGRDNYSGNWGPGLGPASVPLTYLGPGTTQRSAIEIHYDANHGSSPGTAGCVGLNSITDLKTLVGWLRRVDPELLVVDWGITA